ncbi:hypothetical protein [Novosphingobium sp.]|uniref:hypothetical protein n=1 Tax=Novosphingobium sp. TaxID=1874826 RepID=UPI00286E2659|nr:hypothetical protein [Novosphingobium sp.]
MAIRRGQVPEKSLLAAYGRAGNYTDCFIAEVPGQVAFSRFVEAFYSSACFRPERFLLMALLGKRSSAQDIRALAAGQTDHFAAWTVEARTTNEVLLCDFQQATRSWLMAEPLEHGGTRLWFGSAVVLTGQTGARRTMGQMTFAALGWFHRIYSRALLWAAIRGL